MLKKEFRLILSLNERIAMRPIELGQKCIDYIFNKRDYKALEKLLAKDLHFRGPLYNFDTAKDYIKALKADPPTDFTYNMIGAYEDYSSSCLVYEYSKAGKTVTVSQIFEIENDKIQSILIIYDSKILRGD